MNNIHTIGFINMKLLSFCVVLFLLPKCSQSNYPNSNVITLNEQPLTIIPDTFVSFAIDMALIVGAKWWDDTETFTSGRGGSTTKKLNLKNPQLIKAIRDLSPTLIRIGGTEADHVFYNFENATLPKGFDSLLGPNRIDQLFEFLKDIDSKLIFTINAGHGVRTDGKWKKEQLKALLNYFKLKEYQVPYFEFGNEISAFWAIHGPFKTISSDQYQKDFLLFKDLIKKHDPTSLTLGPASAFWPIIGEPGQFLFGLNDHAMKYKYPDIISWHYYPTQSKRCPFQVRGLDKGDFFDPTYLDEFRDIAKELVSKMKKYKNSSPLWLGETGSAQCGGVKGISDKVESSFWWLDQLGLAAQTGQKQVIRQSIYGGDYAILNSDFSPRSDYWATYFWKKFMGPLVLKVQKKHIDPYLRIYSHRDKSNQTRLLALNLSDQEKTLEIKKYQVADQCYFIKNLESQNQHKEMKCLKKNSSKILVSPKSISFLRLDKS